MLLLLLLGRVALVAQRPIVVKLSRHPVDDLSVCTYVRASVGLSSAFWKTANRIRMPFGIIGRTGPAMRQVVGFGDPSTERGIFWGEFWARYCNQWGLYGICVPQCRDAVLFPNYFGQTCYNTLFYLLSSYSTFPPKFAVASPPWKQARSN